MDEFAFARCHRVKVIVHAIYKKYIFIGSGLDDIGFGWEETSRVVIVEENKPFAGWGAQVAYEIQHRAFDSLDAPIERVTGLDVPQPYARVLEQAVMPSAERVTEAAKKTLG